MTLAEELLAVANNRPKLYKKGALDYSPQETVSGEAIGITDISPIEHNMGVSVRKMNLLKYPYVGTLGGTSTGLTITDNGDGTLTINGTETDSTKYKSFFFMDKELHDYLIDGLKYYGGIEKPDSTLAGQIYILVKNNATGANEWLSGNSFTVNKSKYTYSRIYVQINGSSSVFENTVFKPYLTLYDTKKYAPYIEDISTVKLYKQGKNLADSSLYSGGAINPNSYTEITYKLNSVLPANIPLRAKLFFEDGARLDTGYQLTIRQRPYYQEGELLKDATNKAVTLTEEETTKAKYVYIYVNATGGATYGSKIPYGLMITLDTPTEYEPYIEPTIYDVSSSGIVEGVTSLYPNTTLYTDTSGVVIDCTYYQDGRKVKENLTDMILSLGGVINE